MNDEWNQIEEEYKYPKRKIFPKAKLQYVKMRNCVSQQISSRSWQSRLIGDEAIRKLRGAD